MHFFSVFHFHNNYLYLSKQGIYRIRKSRKTHKSGVFNTKPTGCNYARCHKIIRMQFNLLFLCGNKSYFTLFCGNFLFYICCPRALLSNIALVNNWVWDPWHKWTGSGKLALKSKIPSCTPQHNINVKIKYHSYLVSEEKGTKEDSKEERSFVTFRDLNLEMIRIRDHFFSLCVPIYFFFALFSHF